MTDEPALLHARGLGVRVARGGASLLHDVDLDVAAGERIAVVGPSGAGKSLLVRALLDALPPTLRREGHLALSTRTAWVQQDSALALHPLVPVGRQLAVPLRRMTRTRREARRAAAGLVERVALADPARVLRALPGELSGGERQRVCLALALATDAGLVLADEPTSALDTLSRAQVLDVLASLPSALVLVTHDLAVAAALCHRTLQVVDGRVVELEAVR